MLGSSSYDATKALLKTVMAVDIRHLTSGSLALHPGSLPGGAMGILDPRNFLGAKCHRGFKLCSRQSSKP
jgi:hypothetical protein